MNEKKNGESKYRVQVLERALDILDSFNFQERQLGLSEFSQKTGLNMATTKRLLYNLTERGYLQQDPQSKKYQLGMRLFELGGIVFSSLSLRKSAAPVMNELQDETDGTILLGTNLDDELVYIDKRRGSGMISIASDVGWRRPLHYGMLGMVLMAFSPPEKIRTVLTNTPLIAYTPYSLTDPDAFSLRMEEIRKNGYCFEKGEAVEGIMGAAAPIMDYSRKVIAALGIAQPMNLDNKKDINDVIKILLKATRKISDNLGYMKV